MLLRRLLLVTVVILSAACRTEPRATAAPEPSVRGATARGEIASVVCGGLSLVTPVPKNRYEYVLQAFAAVESRVTTQELKNVFSALTKPGMGFDHKVAMLRDTVKDLAPAQKTCPLLDFAEKAVPRGPVVSAVGDDLFVDGKPAGTLAATKAAKASGTPVILEDLKTKLKFLREQWIATHTADATPPRLVVIDLAPETDAFTVKCIAATAAAVGLDEVQPMPPVPKP